MDHHRLHSCDRDRDAATGNESIGREASRTGGSGKCVGCGYRQTRHSVRCLAVDGTAGTWMELDEGNLFALSPSLTRCYWYGARRGGAGDLVRQRLSLSQGDAAEHDRRSPRSGRRMGLTTLRQASRCVRLCPRGCVRRSPNGGAMVVSPDTPGHSGGGCVRVLSICCFYVFSFIGHRTH